MKKLAWALPVLSLLVVLFWGILWWPYTVDDSYITYRYSLNTAKGLGAVFNPGERVEGYSSPLWMVVLALTTWAGLDPVPVSKVLGLGAALALVWIFGAALRRWGVEPWIAGFAMLWLATTPTLHVYSSSGMETLWFALAVAAAALLPAGTAAPGARAWWIGIGIVTVPLLRPEGILVAGLLTLLWVIQYRSHEARLALLAAWLVLAGWFVWRFSYYGAWLPNTFVAKPSPIIRTFAGGHLGFGAFKLFDSLRDNLLPALAEQGGTLALFLVLAALALKREVGALWSAALAAAAGTFFVVYARSDWMLGFRFAIPFAAPFLFLAALGADGLRERMRGPKGRGLGLLAAACVSWWCVWSTIQTGEYLSRHGQGTVNTAMNAEVYERIGKWLGENSRPGDRLLAYEVGAVAYASGIYIIDQHGLITPDVARIVQWAEGDYREIRIGKDRQTMDRIVEYCAAQRPEWFLLRTIRPLAVAPGGPVPAGIAMDAMQNAVLDKIGDSMVFAEAFQMRPDSPHWKDDRYLLLRRRDAAGG